MIASTCFYCGVPDDVAAVATVELTKFGLPRQVVPDAAVLESFLRHQLPACVVAPLADYEAVLEVIERTDSPTVVIALALDFDVSQIVRALRCGVYHVLDPAVEMAELPAIVEQASRRSAELWAVRQTQAQARSLLNALSKKEWAVLRLVLQGMPNKEIAARLGIALRTVESRRSSIFAKLKTRSLCDIAAKIQASEAAVPGPHFALMPNAANYGLPQATAGS